MIKFLYKEFIELQWQNETLPENLPISIGPPAPFTPASKTLPKYLAPLLVFILNSLKKGNYR